MIQECRAILVESFQNCSEFETRFIIYCLENNGELFEHLLLRNTIVSCAKFMRSISEALRISIRESDS